MSLCHYLPMLSLLTMRSAPIVSEDASTAPMVLGYAALSHPFSYRPTADNVVGSSALDTAKAYHGRISGLRDVLVTPRSPPPMVLRM